MQQASGAVCFPPMHLAYIDESGDAGLANSPTKFFVLSCVLVPAADWLERLDTIIALRKYLHKELGIATRPEIKATDIRRGRGPLTHLKWSLTQRMELYAKLMKFQATKLDGVRTFAIAIEKERAANERSREARETAWEYSIQRLNKFCGDDDLMMMFPDEGHGYFIRKLLRKMRRFHKVPRHWGGGSISFETKRVIEDPNDRQSHDSYFVQLADWNAYAAHRSVHIDPQPGVSGNLWDALGPRLLLPVNQNTGGPPGIVKYPL